MPTYTRKIEATLIDSGLAGTLGYTVLAADDTVLIPRTTDGVVEDGTSGVYKATVIDWDTEWAGSVDWDAGDGVLASETFLAYDPESGPSIALILDHVLKIPTMASGFVVDGSTNSVVIVSGLPAGRQYVGQRLYHTPSGEARLIVSQEADGDDYVFEFPGLPGTASGPFSSLVVGDLVSPTP